MGDLLANRKHLNEILGIFVYAQNAISAIWRLTLRHVLTGSLELNFLRETIVFVLNNKYSETCLKQPLKIRQNNDLNVKR